MEEKEISQAVIRRMPRYYRYLGELLDAGVERISSNDLSKRMNVTASQIRQDLNNFGGFGQQGYGYNVKYLYEEIGKILGLNEKHNIIVIGAGNLGQALANYVKFEKLGFMIIGLFDVNPALDGVTVRGIKIHMLEELEQFCAENQVDIAALTMPKAKADAIANRLVDAGIHAIGNFALVDLELIDKDVVVENVHVLKDMIREEYPGVPYVVFGHSMGSFITRNFVHKYGAEIDGAVISATGLQPKGILAVMKVAVAVLTAFQGSRHVSKFMDKMAFGTYLKRIENPKTPYDWLSVNEENVQKYMADDQCGFIFTLNGFKTLQGLCRGLFDTEKIASIPKDLPMLFIYGDEDPVGAYGEGVERSCQMYVDAGMEKVSKILYPGKRHELLNEDNRADVMQDVYNWITGKVLDRLDQRQV